MWLMFSIYSMFSMFSQLTPCSPIRDGRMEQFVEPCLPLALAGGFFSLLKPESPNNSKKHSQTYNPKPTHESQQ